MRRSLLLDLLILGTAFTYIPAEAIDIVNEEKMPYALDSVFINELWLVVVSAVNDEAIFLKVTLGTKPPMIVYESVQPANGKGFNAEMAYSYDNKARKVKMEIPRTLYLYPRPFAISPAIVYGALAQEFLHEAMLYQGVTPEMQHCLMIGRGTLAKALEFVDFRLKTGNLALKTIRGETVEQCRDDLEKVSR